MGKGPNNPGGFNGGGSTNKYGGSGGGGTDIRINSTSLYARVIVAGGGGGSGYVYTSSTASNYPAGCLLNSSYYLTNAATLVGNTSFPSPSGANEVGHSGDGYARITVLNLGLPIFFNIGGSLKKYSDGWVKIDGSLRKIEAIWIKVDGVLKKL